MDIKEIAKRIRKTNNSYMLSTSPDIAAEFAEALIESYKAELLKEVGEPVNFCNQYSLDRVAEYNNALVRIDSTFHEQSPVAIYTSDQVAAAIAKATKPLEEQLAAAQEEIRRLNALMLERNQEYFQQLTKAEQLWQVAQGRCDGLEEKLAKAEQRVAEAERDASRYRFLRDTCEMTRSFRMKGEFKNEDGDLTEYEWNSGPSAIYFDKAIDAEMARLNGASS